MKTQHILCIIVTYNGAAHIRACLENLGNADVALDILVIDNMSEDETVLIIEQEFSHVKVIRLSFNSGFGHANNIGFKYGLDLQADYFVLVNQDVYVEPQAISRLIKVAENNPGFGILSPLHMNGDASDFDYLFSLSLSPNNCGRVIFDAWFDHENLRGVYSCGFVNAAFWLVSRKCIAKVGGFDPLFSHYGEDNDFVNRSTYYGFSTGICPQVKIRHNRDRGNGLMRSSEVNQLYLSHQISLKNINFPISYLAKLCFSKLIGTMISSLLLFEFGIFRVYFVVFIRVLSRFRAIKRSRKRCMNGNSMPFLEA